MTPQEATQRYHWIKADEQTHTIDIYCDHHMLSTFRMCESKFVIEHLLNLRPQGHKAYSLTFGAYLHKCFEEFYNSMKLGQGTPLPILDFLALGNKYWYAYNMDAYKDEKKYKAIGGREGALALLASYHCYYQDLRVRVVDTEVCFGFNKECPLGQFIMNESAPYGEGQDIWYVNCYLTGRVDLVVDNGFKIGPVDHKHHASFRGDEHKKFNPHDGITGYIYALSCILRNNFPTYYAEGRKPNSGWIYHIAAAIPADGDRFKATPVDKTESQFTEYKQRQLSTFRRISEILFLNSEAQWNTSACHNIYNRDCEYLLLHEQAPENRIYVIDQHFQKAPAWNPAQMADDDMLLKRDKVQEALQILE